MLPAEAAHDALAAAEQLLTPEAHAAGGSDAGGQQTEEGASGE